MVELDAAARAATAEFETIGPGRAPDAPPLTTDLSSPHLELEPLLLFFDFALPFPSIAKAHLRRVAKRLTAVPGARRLLACFIAAAKAHIWAGCTSGRSIRVVAGVAQGCPLSGLLFVGAVQPLLTTMQAALSPRGDLWAFADDLDALLRSPPEQLRRLSALFRLARSGTGLTLKPAKSVIVPLAGSADPTT